MRRRDFCLALALALSIGVLVGRGSVAFPAGAAQNPGRQVFIVNVPANACRTVDDDPFCRLARIRMAGRPLSVSYSITSGDSSWYSATGGGIDVYHTVAPIAGLKFLVMWKAGWFYVLRSPTQYNGSAVLKVVVTY